MHILVVDDYHDTLTTLGRQFKRAHHTVALAHGIAEARAALAPDQPDVDLAIVDLVLGTESGLELIAELRLRSPPMQIILHTALPDTEVVVHAMRLGATTVVPKPASAADLLRALGRQPVLDLLSISRRWHMTLTQLENALAARTLEACQGNKTHAADRLGISRATMHRWALDLETTDDNNNDNDD